jgi:hypothetical protein
VWDAQRQTPRLHDALGRHKLELAASTRPPKTEKESPSRFVSSPPVSPDPLAGFHHSANPVVVSASNRASGDAFTRMIV